mgnify:CR=1 FL=1
MSFVVYVRRQPDATSCPYARRFRSTLSFQRSGAPGFLREIEISRLCRFLWSAARATFNVQRSLPSPGQRSTFNVRGLRVFFTKLQFLCCGALWRPPPGQRSTFNVLSPHPGHVQRSTFGASGFSSRNFILSSGALCGGYPKVTRLNSPHCGSAFAVLVL